MRRLSSLVVSLTWLLNGCTSWKAEEVTPASYLSSHHPDSIRLTLQDSTRLTLDSAAVVGDSIVGLVDDTVHYAVSQEDVRAFEVRGTSRAKTAGLVVGVVAGVLAGFAGLVAIECSDLGCD